MNDNYYGMPIERYDFLMEAAGPCAHLSEDEMKQGWHFCGDWDYLLVHPDSPEFRHCRCVHMNKFRTEERTKAQEERRKKINEALDRIAALDEEMGFGNMLRRLKDDTTT